MSDLDTVEPPETPSISLEEEMKRSYLDYAMSVIVSRALPDIRDGLKPVHRRILYAMRQGGYTSDKPYRKSARIVGDVMGQYHPHGDSAIYDSLVRMAQDFSMRLPLIDGQGNFGSQDGDPPAQMRYTEARMDKAAEAILEDIDKDTVDFRPNYDESTKEPEVLPSLIPNLLVNGAGGIAVGMATNIPPHNLEEVIDGCFAYMDNPDIDNIELMQYIPGPDFPTGGEILGRSAIHSAYTTGNGSMRVRSKSHVEEIRERREAIVVTEVPYQVNKGKLLERLGEVGRHKIVEDIAEIRDESDREGVRIVIELKRNADADVVLNQLYKHTALRSSFPANMVALNRGRPEMLTLKSFISAFIDFREEVITRRTIYKLNKARARAHVLAGLAVAVANIDEIIALIRNAPDPNTARTQLLDKRWETKDVRPLIELIDDPEYPVFDDNTYQMSEDQARAILDLRLHRLTGLERDKIGDELRAITDDIAEYLSILGDREKLREVLREELLNIRERFGTPRRTAILDGDFDEDIEALIQREDMVVTITHGGYVKRVPLDTYRAQKRGGKGRAGTSLKDEDFVSDMFVASTHTPILFFTSRGLVHKMKVYQLPLGTPQARGKALVNLMPLEQDETISVYMRLPEDEEIWSELDITFATSDGRVRRNKLSDFKNIRSNGLIAMKLDDDQRLVSVKICREDENIMLSTKLGKAIRFPAEDVRVFSGRTSSGVRGIKLAKGDEVISMSILKHVETTPDERTAYLKVANQMRCAEEDEADIDVSCVELSEERFKELQDKEEFLMCVTKGGYGKRTSAYEYRLSGRGGQGVTNMNLTNKNGGEAVANFPVTDEHQVMLVTDQGQMIRTFVHNVRFTSRSTQGVRLFNVGKDEKVVSVAWLINEDEDDAENIESPESGTAAAEAGAEEIAATEADSPDEAAGNEPAADDDADTDA